MSLMDHGFLHGITFGVRPALGRFAHDRGARQVLLVVVREQDRVLVELAQARGAVLGKAMSSLKEGKGLVLVLVTLQ